MSLEQWKAIQGMGTKIRNAGVQSNKTLNYMISIKYF